MKNPIEEFGTVEGYPSKESFKDAALELIDNGPNERVIGFLKKNKDRQGFMHDFCCHVMDSYSPGDNSGLVHISILVKKLLEDA